MSNGEAMTTTDDRADPPDGGLNPRGARVPGAGTSRHRVGLLRTWPSRQAALRGSALVLLVAVPALTLRLWAIDALGLNSDEAVYAGQAASLAHDPGYLSYFPVFRAHPLLFQSLLSLEYDAYGVTGLAGRVLSVAFGMATVWVTYGIGARLYGRRVGVLAALLIGVMPYLVVVNRQILLDGPMTFFSALALYLLIRFVQTTRAPWLYAAAAAL